MLAFPIAFCYQHNSLIFKWRDNYPWFMDGESKALKELKDWISLFAKQLIKFSFIINSLFQETPTV